MGITAFDLNENLDCLDNIHQGKFSNIYASAEAAMDKRFHNSLKLKQKIRYLAAKSLDWTEKSFSFACKRYFIFTQDELLKCLRIICDISLSGSWK